MSTSTDKQRKLVRALIKKTDADELDWKPTVKEGTYQVSFTESSLQIEECFNENIRLFSVSLFDSNGNLVDKFDDEELDKDIFPKNHAWFTQMKNLYEMVRRRVTGADRVLNRILVELEDDMPF
jgi:hypothetical protein